MTSTARFVPGRIVSRKLSETLLPGLRSLLPNTPLALAIIGPGSDVLGYDSGRSMDHDWGPRLTVVVPEKDVDKVLSLIEGSLGELLPTEVSGFPTRFSRHADGTLRPDPAGQLHGIEVTSIRRLLRTNLLIDSLEELNDAVWLSTPMQSLLELTSGEVFIDDTGELVGMRNALSFYPDHIWRYQLAGLWMRVSQVQPFIGRCFEADDVAGAAAIAMTIQRDFMRLALLQSRRFAPYAKWISTAMKETSIARELNEYFLAIGRNIEDFMSLESALNRVGQGLIEQLNELGLIPEVDPKATQFHTRPFPAEEIAFALRDSLQGAPLDWPEAIIGGIDVISDSTDALGSREFRLAIRSMFTA